MAKTMKIQYSGGSDVRSFRKSDFRHVGVEDQGAVVFSNENGFVAEVSESAASYLLKTGEFKDTDKTRTKASPLTRLEPVPVSVPAAPATTGGGSTPGGP